jgi:hypothetical protein
MTDPDPFANIAETKLNSTFSSLLSASPTAAKLTLDLASFLSTSTPSLTPDSSTPSTGGSSTPTTTPGNSGPPPSSNTSNGVSAGIIAGAVIGGVVGLALVIGGIFLLLRRKRGAAKGSELDGNPYRGRTEMGGKSQGHYQPVTYALEAEGHPAPVEMPVHHVPVEMEGSRPARS